MSTQTTFEPNPYPDGFLPYLWRIDHVGQPPWPLPQGQVVENVEGVCRGVVKKMRRYLTDDLSNADHDETILELFSRVPRLAAEYAPTGAPRFPAYLHDRLCKRTIDFWRSWFGRDGRHRINTDTALGFATNSTVDDRDHGDPRLGEATFGDEADRFASGGWVLASGDRRRARSDGIVRVGEGWGTAGGDAAAGERPRLNGGRPGRSQALRVAPFVDCACGWRNFIQAPNGVDRWHFETCTACGAGLEATVAA